MINVKGKVSKLRKYGYQIRKENAKERNMRFSSMDNIQQAAQLKDRLPDKSYTYQCIGCKTRCAELDQFGYCYSCA